MRADEEKEKEEKGGGEGERKKGRKRCESCSSGESEGSAPPSRIFLKREILAPSADRTVTGLLNLGFS